jgi:hypothetical protein
MTTKPKFITCNYTNLYGTKLNGRLNRDFIYMYSLRGIAECGDTIINYTCPYNIEIAQPYFDAQGIKNIVNVDYDLTTSPYHSRVDAIKDIKPQFFNETSWLNRCVEIMWGKFLWLEENFNSLEDDDYLFWIDAGLSHGGILPRMYNVFEGNKKYYKKEKPEEMELEFAHRHDRVFNKDFVRKLEAYTGDKITVICANHNQHGDSLGFDYYNHLAQWPIGGLFGGKKKVMLPFIARFKELADTVMEKELLVKEEQIMAVILNEKPEWFKTFTFETWYHPDWNTSSHKCYVPTMKSFFKFFEEIINVP